MASDSLPAGPIRMLKVVSGRSAIVNWFTLSVIHRLNTEQRMWFRVGGRFPIVPLRQLLVASGWIHPSFCYFAGLLENPELCWRFTERTQSFPPSYLSTRPSNSGTNRRCTQQHTQNIVSLLGPRHLCRWWVQRRQSARDKKHIWQRSRFTQINS